VSVRVAEGLLRVQAIALHGGADLDAWMLLWWNRQTRLVRFGCTRSRDIWVHADVPVGSVDGRELDRVLGLVAEAALAVRGLRRPAAAR
jgi:Putative bacterial sensory transduction regulator